MSKATNDIGKMFIFSLPYILNFTQGKQNPLFDFLTSPCYQGIKEEYLSYKRINSFKIKFEFILQLCKE